MADDERLREALVELELLRKREAHSHRETQALLNGLECIHSDRGRAASIRALLKVVSETLECDHAFVMHSTPTGSRISLADSPDLEGLSWKPVGVPVDKSRRIVDVRTLISRENDVPCELRSFHSLLIEPIRITEGDTSALTCVSQKRGLFSKRDSRLFKRFCNIASQALAGLDLEEHNAFLAAVIAESSSSVAIGDIGNGKLSLSYVNKAFETLNGCSAAEVLGQNEQVFWSEDAPDLEEFRQCIIAGGTGTFRLPNQRQDNGKRFCNEIAVTPILTSDAPIRHVVLTQADVSQQVKAESERDEARKRLEAALSSTGEGFLAMDGDGKILFANKRFEEFVAMFRIAWGIGSHFTDIWTRYLMNSGIAKGEAQHKAEAYLQRLLTQARSLEVRLPDGRTVLVNERPVSGGGAVIVASDITPLKAAEQTLLQRAAAIENVQDGIAITDQHGRLNYANPQLTALWGMESVDDLFGRKWQEFYENSDAGALLRRHVGDQATSSARGELRCKGNAKEVHLVSLTLVADLGHVVTVHDMTERIEEERSRAVLRERLQAAQRQEALGQMAAGLAHDFNNLLSAITGSANLITEDETTSPSSRKAAGRIATAGYRAADLVNKLLDLGASEQAREEIDLRALLQEALDFARPSMRPGVRLTATLGDSAVRSYASRTDVLQLALNLIMNSLDALPAEGGEITLELDSAPDVPDGDILQLGRIDNEYDYAKISVRDTGSGIPARKINDIFGAYFTTKGDKGTGLGLAVVASVVKAIDGGLLVRSVEGSGTTFDIYWPLTAPATRAETPDSSEGTLPDLDGLPILVVDDESAVAQVIARMLEKAGAEVSALDDPELALEVISDDPDSWGCLITDYNMPGVNGGELVDKTHAIAPDLPKIVVTALARRLHDPRITTQTVDAVLAKPVEPGKLLGTVHAAIERRRPQRED